ncbi:GNAT family N-acetyltransferase [candidate division KSB1 bacterium]|nr:GNAT family N-acetyltransferase [candidate division KSB1 bacterium]
MRHQIKLLKSLSDISQVIRLHNKTWNHSTGIIDLLENSTECILCYHRSGKQIIGYLFMQQDDVRGFMEINDLVVDSDFRHLGYGKLLVNHAQTKTSYLKLNADATNIKLVEFYQNLGFQVEITIENYYSIGKDAVRMVWKDKNGIKR